MQKYGTTSQNWNPPPHLPLYPLGVEFSKFLQRKGGSDFSHKTGGVGKIEGCFKKGCITYFHTKTNNETKIIPIKYNLIKFCFDNNTSTLICFVSFMFLQLVFQI